MLALMLVGTAVGGMLLFDLLAWWKGADSTDSLREGRCGREI